MTKFYSKNVIKFYYKNIIKFYSKNIIKFYSNPPDSFVQNGKARTTLQIDSVTICNQQPQKKYFQACNACDTVFNCDIVILFLIVIL